MIFKNLRSLIGRLFSENIQMKIVLFLSDSFWFLRKYFLAISIPYPKDFIDNWKSIKSNTSQDKERNFTIYQLIKTYNSIFKDQYTNIIEFGVDRGGTLTTICKFVKPNTNIYALDSFGFYAKEIKKNVTDFDPHYQGLYKPFTKKTRFHNFDHTLLETKLNEEILKNKNSKTKIIKCFFPDIIDNVILEEINSKSFSFVHFDFDLFTPTYEAIQFIKPKLAKNAILLFDDYNNINQEGVKHAIEKSALDISKSIQTQSGQLICWI